MSKGVRWSTVHTITNAHGISLDDLNELVACGALSRRIFGRRNGWGGLWRYRVKSVKKLQARLGLYRLQRSV